MKNILIPLSLALTLIFICTLALAQRGSHSYHSSGSRSTHSTYSYHRSYSHSSTSHVSTGRHRSSYATGVARDSRGRIRRSSSARHSFMKDTGYPHGRKGYIIDHIVPLSKGGCDCPANMQWQTVEEAKQKDKTERK